LTSIEQYGIVLKVTVVFSQQNRKDKKIMKGMQGFASMTPEKVRDIASKGGKRSHELGVAHKWTSEEAANAGRIGGRISRRGPSVKKENV
jgi:hypothetical protein